MRYTIGLLAFSLSLIAVAQTNPSPGPAPQEQTLQPKDAEVDRNKTVQGNAWSLEAKSPPGTDAGTHTKKGKPDGGHP